jgi:DNA repair protein RecO (recombination protein O)
VIRRYKLAESDRIIVMLTEHNGIVRAVAKGVRRTTSKFGARLDPFVHARILFHRGRQLDTVSQAEIVDAHVLLREDYRRFVFGSAMLEMAWRSLHEDQQVPRLFEALDKSLHSLEEEACDHALLLAAFELKVCSLVGYRPRLLECARCGKALSGPSTCLSLESGGAVCEACRGLVGSTRPIALESLALAQRLLFEPMQEIASIQAPRPQVREALRLSFDFTEHHLERGLKSHAVVLQHLSRESQ